MVLKNAVSVYCKAFGLSCHCHQKLFVVKEEEVGAVVGVHSEEGGGGSDGGGRGVGWGA